MSNTSLKNGFQILDQETYKAKAYPFNASTEITAGDIVYMTDAGYADDSVNSGKLLGIAGSNIFNGLTLDLVTDTDSSTTRGDFIMVYDSPELEFTGELTEFTLTDPITTLASSACYDGAGTTGVEYVDAGASSNDEIRVKRLWNEPNGDKSVAGAYAKCVFMFNSAKHLYGHVS